MSSISSKALRGKRNNALRAARATIFHDHLLACSRVMLYDEAYKRFQKEGWTRNQVDLAVADLVEEGLAKIEHHHLWLIVTPIFEDRRNEVAA